MSFRPDSFPRVRLWVAALFLLFAVQRPAAVRRSSPPDSLARAKHLAWLNNWAEAARVLERMNQSGRLDADKATRVFSRAVEIRGNIESLPLPSAAKELASMLETGARRDDAELRLLILAMKGEIEFQYDLPAAEKTWTEVGRLASAMGQTGWEARSGGELGCIAFLNGEVFTALKRVATAYFRAEFSNDVR
jgi:hypothetical protein